MATIIPAEYFGGSGIGSMLSGIGDVARDVRDTRRERKDIQQADADRLRNQKLQDLEYLMALMPNDPDAWMSLAAEIGVVPEGAPRTPGSAEQIESIRRDWIAKGPDSPEYWLAVTGQPLTAGETRRGAIAGVEAAEGNVTAQELQIDELQYNKTSRTARDLLFNDPTIRARLKIPEGVTVNAGTISGLETVLGLEGLDLRNELTQVQTVESRKNLLLMDARLKQINAEIASLEGTVDPATMDWVAMVSKGTLWQPSQILAAMDPESGLDDNIRNAIVKDVGDLQQSITAETQQRFREASGTDAIQKLQMLKTVASENPGLVNEDMWGAAVVDAYSQIGIAAEYVPAIKRALWFDSPSEINILSNEELANQIIGSETPSTERELSDSEVAADAVGMVRRFGNVANALAELEKVKGEWSTADYNALKSSIEAQESITAPTDEIVAEVPSPEPTDSRKRILEDRHRSALRRLRAEERRLELHVNEYGADPQGAQKRVRETIEERIREEKENIENGATEWAPLRNLGL